MKKILTFLFLIPLLIQFGNAQNTSNDTPKYGIQFNGFVKTDVFYDTRQVVSAREGHFLLYPQPEYRDKFNKDINANPSFNILSIQTRLTGKITGPDVLGAKTNGLIEGAFFGHSDPDINGFRLRHAFLKMKWTSSELLIGQYWHPMFVAEAFPEVISFNTGVPFQPFSRNPQIRYGYQLWKLKLVGVAQSQRDFTSTGPNGLSSEYLRNSAIPDLHFQVQFNQANADKGNEILAIVGGGYKTLVPRMFTNNAVIDNNKVTLDRSSETISSFSGFAMVKVKLPVLTCKAQGTYGENMTDVLMLGGYGVQLDTNLQNQKLDKRTYTNINSVAAWSEIYTNGKKWQFGVFGGYTQNLGSYKQLSKIVLTGNDQIFTRGINIHNVYRIAPRVIFNYEKMRFALELEHTTATYGRAIDSYGKIVKKDPVNPNLKQYSVSNNRILFAAYYFF